MKIRHLKKIYDNGLEAIKDISFDLDKGEIISIVGTSGCGKSTLLNIIDGLESKTSGSIILDSDNISYMFQKDALLEYKNILDNACLGLELSGVKTQDNISSVKTLLDEFGLSKFIYSYPNSLSGGMRQRVSLIRSLATNPDLILLDEPFSALDYYTRIKISDEVLKMMKKTETSAIIITHDIGEAICMGDKIIVLSKRPSIVKNIYRTNFESSLSMIEKRTTDEFDNLYKRIWSDLDV